MNNIRPLLVLLLLTIARPVGAQQIPHYYLTGPIHVEATMTKVSETAFDFSYSITPWMEMPPNYIEPATQFDPGHTWVYFPGPLGISAISGDFGLVTDGFGNENYDVYASPVAFWGGFQFQQAPHEPWSVFARGDILANVTTGGQPNSEGGTWSGSATIWGDVPQLVGESTTWAVTPEPPVWLLLGFGLLPVLKFRRRVRVPRSFTTGAT
jgi:hypothetical protein